MKHVVKRAGSAATGTAPAVLVLIVAAALAACSFPVSQAATPVISPASGVFDTQISVTITCATPGAVIYFTTNGAAPSESSLVYEDGLIIKTHDAHIVAIARAPGMQDSAEARADFLAAWMEYPDPDNPVTTPFTLPRGIALDAEGRIYTTNGSSAGFLARIDNMTGAGLQTLAGFNSPAGIMVTAGGQVFVANANSHQIVRVDGFAAPFTTYGSYGTTAGPGLFNLPNGVVDNGAGVTYVADTSNNRIDSFTNMSDAGWYSWGTLGSGSYQFSGPQGITLGPDGRIYVADTANNRIAVMQNATTGWLALGGPTAGNAVGQFNHPGAVAVDGQGRVYVADTLNNRVVRFDDMSGAGWKESYGPITGPLSSPRGIAVDPAGLAYVVDTVHNRIIRVIF